MLKNCKQYDGHPQGRSKGGICPSPGFMVFKRYFGFFPKAFALGLVLSRKNLSSENFSDKFRKFNIDTFFLKIFLTSFLVLLAGKISADFSSEFLIGTQSEKSVEFSEV
jgi:hypothetical protein